MSFTRKSLLALLLHFSISSAASNVCSSGLYAKFLPILAGYAPAQQWCSSHYPVAPVPYTTTVHSGAATTVTDTSTTHVTNTHTTTVIVTSTSTPTFAGSRKVKARRAPKTTAVNPTSTCYTSLQRAATSVAKTVCSCIETPRTVTSTRTISGTTAHTTVTSTATDDTTTTLTTTTVVAPPPPHVCYDSTCETDGSGYYEINCGSAPTSYNAITTSGGTTVYDCEDACYNYGSGCVAMMFSYSANTCTLLSSYDANSVTANSDKDWGYPNPPNCPRQG